MSWTLTGTIVEPDGTPAEGVLVAIVSPTPARSSSGRVIDRDRASIPVTSGLVGDTSLESIPGSTWTFLLPAGRRITIDDPGDGAVINLGADLPVGEPVTPEEASLLRAEIARIQAEGLKGDKGDDGKQGDAGHSPLVAMSGDQITVDGKVVGPHLSGPSGPASSLSVGTVTTGAPGSSAAARLTGTAPNQVLDLTVPQGPAGAPGQPTAFELRGTGMPEGKVAADPGTYYTDTAGTNGAWRWLKKTGTGSTGWAPDGLSDTGPRDLTASAGFPGGVMGGDRLMVRRIGSSAYIYVFIDKRDTAPGTVTLTLPAWAKVENVIVPFSANGGNPTSGLASIGSGVTIYNIPANTTARVTTASVASGPWPVAF